MIALVLLLLSLVGQGTVSRVDAGPADLERLEQDLRRFEALAGPAKFRVDVQRWRLSREQVVAFTALMLDEPEPTQDRIELQVGKLVSEGGDPYSSKQVEVACAGGLVRQDWRVPGRHEVVVTDGVRGLSLSTANRDFRLRSDADLPIVYSPTQCLQPLTVDPSEVVSRMGELAVSYSAESWGPRLTLRLEDGGTEVAIDMQVGSNLPFRTISRKPSGRTISVYSYGRGDEGDHWLEAVYRLREWDGGAKLTVLRISDVSFLVEAEDARLPMSLVDDLPLFDSRTGRLQPFGRSPVDWPASIRDFVFEDRR